MPRDLYSSSCDIAAERTKAPTSARGSFRVVSRTAVVALPGSSLTRLLCRSQLHVGHRRQAQRKSDLRPCNCLCGKPA